MRFAAIGIWTGGREIPAVNKKCAATVMAWLDHVCGATQVIATRADAVWPRVMAGSFLEALYYRLNVIYIDLTNGQHRYHGQTLLPLRERPRRL